MKRLKPRLISLGLLAVVGWFASMGCNGDSERSVPVPCEVDTQGNRRCASPVPTASSSAPTGTI